MYRVYKITNKLNNKKYIGITSRTVKERFFEHLSRAKNDIRFSRLYMAIRKYGKSNFDVVEIATTKDEDAVRQLEGYFIKKYDSYKNGYNCNLGGHGFLHFPEHIKKKISDSQKGKVIPIETRRRMSESKKGDATCSENFGEYVNKGKLNPKAKYFLIRKPNGKDVLIKGLRQFCRENNLDYPKFTSRGKLRNFIILKRFRDYPEKEYTQVGGSGAHPQASEDEDIVRSVWRHTAVHERTDII